MLQTQDSSTSYGQGPRLRIGEMLRDRGLITDKQLQQALESQAQRGHRKLLGEILVELNFVTEHQVLEMLAEGYGVPYVTGTAKLADPKIVELLPRDFLTEHKVLPLFLVRGQLTLAVCNVGRELRRS